MKSKFEEMCGEYHEKLSGAVHLNYAVTVWDNPELGPKWSGFSNESLLGCPVTPLYSVDLPWLMQLQAEEEISYSFCLLVLLYFFPVLGRSLRLGMIIKEVPASLYIFYLYF